MKNFILCLLLLLLQACYSSKKIDAPNAKLAAHYSYAYGKIVGDGVKTHMADVYTTPAGVQKMITALVALKVLGPEARFQTDLFANKKDVVIAFSGDPKFSSADLHNLLLPLKGRNIKGKIMLDVSVFKTPPYSPNLMLANLGKAFAAPVFGANIDENQIEIKVIPYQLNFPALVQLASPYQVVSNVITDNQPTQIRRCWKDGRINVSGNIHFSDDIFEFEMSPLEIEPYVLNKVKTVMRQLNINGKLEFVREPTLRPADFVLINSHRSEALRDMLPEAMANSDNLFFDVLYLSVLNQKSPTPVVSWNEGSDIFNQLIKQYYDVDVANAVIVDGSGLSRYNRIQPRKLLELLKRGYVELDFVQSLPKPSDEKFYKMSREIILLTDDFRIKTGYLDNLVAIAGYKLDAKNPKAFIITANGFDVEELKASKNLTYKLDKDIIKAVGH